MDDLAGTTHDLAVYGRGWTPELIDPRFVKAEGIPNEDLRCYYSSAAIVLNDHWDDMRAEGFLSNRLYDALACGAFVISDDVEGIEAEFDGAIAVYRQREELEPLIAASLADPASADARKPRAAGRSCWSATRSTSGRRRCAPPPTGSPMGVQTGCCRPPSAEGSPYSK